ncbi:hypothetical protein [Trabulsiella odontotermitis]|uniref:hypothetical protein n=1 Tax=Trabulsiella odontotermitis TaxID=379893 RepID=UPI00128F5A34|nr:hypothetical protein [Trabulsiella odontotermitis]
MKKFYPYTMVIISVLLTGCDNSQQSAWKELDFALTHKEPMVHLYHDRGLGVITHRAKFNYAKDYYLLQQTIQKEDPNDNWFCAGVAK